LAFIFRIRHFSLAPEEGATSGQGKDDKMHEDFNTRLWADHGPQFTAAMTDLLAKVRIVFERLVAIEFAAPWERRDDACVDC